MEKEVDLEEAERERLGGKTTPEPRRAFAALVRASRRVPMHSRSALRRRESRWSEPARGHDRG